MSRNSIRNQFIRYSSLNVLGMIALSCYILADTFFVANTVFPMLFLIMFSSIRSIWESLEPYSQPDLPRYSAY